MYKRFVYTVVIVITIQQSAASYEQPAAEFFEGGPGLTHNETGDGDYGNTLQQDEFFGRSDSDGSFQSAVSRCIEEQQYLITESVSQGKHVILKCFKSNLMLNLLRYLGEPSKSSIKLFNGLVEFKKIPEKVQCEKNCDERRGRNLEEFQNKRNEYVRIYKKALQKLINERKRLNAYRNKTKVEKENQLNRIDENSQAFLSEVIRDFGNEEVEKQEEEKLRKEVTDPRLLSVLDALSRTYMLRFRFYPGVSARMMRSDNGGVTFDLEFQESDNEVEEEGSSNESSTREIKEGPEGKDIFDYDYQEEEEDDRNRKKRKDNKKKQKEKKKKAKKLKKVMPYLLLPMIIQASLLPFVFKKLFFLAMKALLAGKMALILVGFNLLRNTCIKNDDDFQKIRVEHYGYRRGEEYGAWINGRSFGEPHTTEELGWDPYLGQKPE